MRWKVISFPKLYRFSRQFPISLFSIAHILRIAVSLLIWLPHLPFTCQPTLQSDFTSLPTWPFWNNYFLNISIVILLRRLCLFLELILINFSRTFARWLPTSFFPHKFPNFFILKFFKPIKSWLNTARSSHHTLHIASFFNILPHFLCYPSFALPHSLCSPFSLSLARLSLQIWCHSKYFNIHFLGCKFIILKP